MTKMPSPAWVLAGLVALMLGLALFGYLSGAWDANVN